MTVSLREAAQGGPHHFTTPDGSILSFDLPAGIKDGTWLRAGSTQVEIRVQPDPSFTLLGHDLFVTVDLPLHLALNGGELPVSTLRGQVKLEIPPFTQNGTRLRLRTQGMPDPRAD